MASNQPQRTRNIKKDKLKINYTLRDWTIQCSTKNNGVVVDGHKLGDPLGEFWHSSLIVQRISKNILLTSTNSVYKLFGKIESEIAAENGLSKEFIEAFKTGFPEDWKTHVDNLMEVRKRADLSAGSAASQTPTPTIQRTVSNSSGDSTGTSSDHCISTPGHHVNDSDPENNVNATQNLNTEGVKKERRHKHKVKKGQGYKSKSEAIRGTDNLRDGVKSKQVPCLKEKKNKGVKHCKVTKAQGPCQIKTSSKKAAKKHHPWSSDEDMPEDDSNSSKVESDENDYIPMKHSVDTGLLPKTRSGRRVFPPLAWYANQHITTKASGVITVTPITTPRNIIPPGDNVIHFKTSKEDELLDRSYTEEMLKQSMKKKPRKESNSNRTIESFDGKKRRRKTNALSILRHSKGRNRRKVKCESEEKIVSTGEDQAQRTNSFTILKNDPGVDTESDLPLKTPVNNRLSGENGQNTDVCDTAKTAMVDFEADIMNIVKENSRYARERRKKRRLTSSRILDYGAMPAGDPDEQHNDVCVFERVWNTGTNTTSYDSAPDGQTPCRRSTDNLRASWSSIAGSTLCGEAQMKSRKAEPLVTAGDQLGLETKDDEPAAETPKPTRVLRSRKEVTVNRDDPTVRFTKKAKQARRSTRTKKKMEDLEPVSYKNTNDKKSETEVKTTNGKVEDLELVSYKNTNDKKSKTAVKTTTGKVECLEPVSYKNTNDKNRKTAVKTSTGKDVGGKADGGKKKIAVKFNQATQNTGDEPTWTRKHVQLLQKAMKEVLPSLPNYWHEVAALLNTGHTAEQCQQYNHKDIPDVLNKPKGRKNKNTKAAGPVKITAGVGTMKRKRQFRELLDDYNTNYSEDVFDSTPLKTKDNVVIPIFEEDESLLSETFNFQTPKGLSQIAMCPLSMRRTPHCDIQTPSVLRSADRNRNDQYINRLKKDMKEKRHSTPKVTQSAVPLEKENLPNWQSVLKTQPSAQPCDDEDKDDYFSDDELFQ